MNSNYISELYRNREQRAFRRIAQILDKVLSTDAYREAFDEIQKELEPINLSEVLILLDNEKTANDKLRLILERTITRLVNDGLYTTNQVKLLVYDTEYRELISNGAEANNCV